MSKSIVALLLSLGVLQAGCVAVAAGAAAGYGGAQYARNGDSRDYPADFPTTWSVTISVLRAAGYGVAPDAAPGSAAGRLEAGDAHVTVEPLTDGTSRVHVRVGTFSTADHRSRAAAILDGIDQRLGRH